MYQELSRQLEEEKVKSLHYHKLSQERKKKVKDMESLLQKEKQNHSIPQPSPSVQISPPPTPANHSNGLQNGNTSNHSRSQSLDVTKEFFYIPIFT